MQSTHAISDRTCKAAAVLYLGIVHEPHTPILFPVVDPQKSSPSLHTRRVCRNAAVYGRLHVGEKNTKPQSVLVSDRADS
jgi:hypothetical protein